MQKHWFIKQGPSKQIISTIEKELKVSPLMASILHQRGLTTHAEIRSFFNPTLEQLHDPFLMFGMKEAVSCLEKHIQNKNKILIYGDYDVDGTTAVALIIEFLKSYADVEYYIPDRHTEGYGISFQGVEYAKNAGCNLIIALDCGVREVEKIKHAKELGLDVIVCDHHNPGDELPNCIVLDPKQAQCTYPYKELCGCGVGFKLLQAWLQFKNEDQSKLFESLDLVAIAIGADIVPITGENRVLCSLGLKRLNLQKREGINALIASAKKTYPFSLSDIVFTIAPRINAAGRLSSGTRAVELLLSTNKNVANEIALEIDAYNTERRELDAETTAEAYELITSDANFETQKSTVVYNPNWHKGVVGIVASRLIEKKYRPTIVLTESNGVATGSARSVAGFNVYEAIKSCEDLLLQFGGHHHAAGLSLNIENILPFKTQFEDYVQKNIQPIEEFEELKIDLEIQLNELFIPGESSFQIPRLYRMLEQLEPFGPGNEKPVFCVKNVYAENQRLLKDQHISFEIIQPNCTFKLRTIGFFMADKFDLIASGCSFDCAFTLETNTFRDKTTLQLQIRDIREAGVSNL